MRVICPMTVGGSFDVKTAALSGSVTALRNEHLRATYLEVDRADDPVPSGATCRDSRD